CLKAMAKEPSRRYASAEELSADLVRWLKGETILARPVGRVERAWRWCRRNPAEAAMTALVIAVMAVGTGVSTYFAIRSNRFAREAEPRAAEAVAERTRAESKTSEAVAERKRADAQTLQANANLAEATRERERADKKAQEAEQSAEQSRQE